MNHHYIRIEVKPKMLLRSTFHRTKRFLQKTFRNFTKSFSLGYQKLPKEQAHEDENFTTKREDFLTPREQAKEDENVITKSSMSGEDQSGRLKELKKEKKANEYCRVKREDSIRLGEKMRGLIEMMDLNNMDHLLDIEEVLHCYSQLTCPVYQEMVDKVFINMYYEFNNIPQTSSSVGSSMRRTHMSSHSKQPNRS